VLEKPVEYLVSPVPESDKAKTNTIIRAVDARASQCCNNACRHGALAEFSPG
jgi:hypothetical protein